MDLSLAWLTADTGRWIGVWAGYLQAWDLWTV